MISWLSKNLSFVCLGIFSLFTLLAIRHFRMPSEKALAEKGVQIAPLFETWRQNPGETEIAQALTKTLEEFPDERPLYEARMGQVVMEKGLAFPGYQPIEASLQRIGRALPLYAFFAESCVAISHGDQSLALKKLLSLEQDPDLEKEPLLRELVLLEILALQERDGRVDRKLILNLEDLVKKEVGEAPSCVSVLGKAPLLQYLTLLEERTTGGRS
ncbi:MAG: hypothetical protein AAGI90_01765 [Chlamydiota bacterium]